MKMDYDLLEMEIVKFEACDVVCASQDPENPEGQID